MSNIPCTDPDLEWRVLSAIWYNPTFAVANSITSDLFVCGLNATLFDAILECDRYGEVSIDAIAAVLSSKGVNRALKAVGELDAVRDIPSESKVSVNRLRALKRAREIRGLLIEGRQFLETGKFGRVDGLIDRLSELRDEGPRFTCMTDAQSMRVAYDALVKGNRICCRFGNEELQRQIGSLPAGDLMVIGGLTNVGKTQFLHWIGRGFVQANDGIRPLWLQLEDGPTVIGAREFAFRFGISIRNEATRNLANDVRDAKDTMDIVYMRGSSFNDVVSQVKAHGKDCGLLMVDYLQAAKHGGKNRHDLVIAENIRELKDIAGSYDMPVIITSQLNTQRQNTRSGIDPFTKPVPANLKDSGSIEDASEVIVLLWKESRKSKKRLAYIPKVKYKNWDELRDYEIIKDYGGMISGLREYIPEIKEQTNFGRR